MSQTAIADPLCGGIRDLALRAQPLQLLQRVRRERLPGRQAELRSHGARPRAARLRCLCNPIVVPEILNEHNMFWTALCAGCKRSM
jgi:hypothetical protein